MLGELFVPFCQVGEEGEDFIGAQGLQFPIFEVRANLEMVGW